MLGLNTLAKKSFGTPNDRAVKAVLPLVNQINALEDEFSALSDDQIKAKTEEFRERVKNGESLDSLLPEAFAIVGACLTVLASAYQFCQEDAKTDDHYFKGFPSYWNIAVFYLFMLGLNPWLNLALVVFLCILVFVPIKYVYPSRTEANQRLTVTLAMIWALSCVAIMMQYPNPHPELIWFSLLYVAYYVGVSVYQTKDGWLPAARRLVSR